jgi:hypothetical protein
MRCCASRPKWRAIRRCWPLRGGPGGARRADRPDGAGARLAEFLPRGEVSALPPQASASRAVLRRCARAWCWAAKVCAR